MLTKKHSYLLLYSCIRQYENLTHNPLTKVLLIYKKSLNFLHTLFSASMRAMISFSSWSLSAAIFISMSTTCVKRKKGNLPFSLFFLRERDKLLGLSQSLPSPCSIARSERRVPELRYFICFGSEGSLGSDRFTRANMRKLPKRNFK